MLLQRHLPNFFCEFVKTYYFCVPHATHSDVLSPKSAKDLGGFQIHVSLQTTHDSCSSSQSSESRRARERERETLQYTNSKLWRVWDFIVIEDIILIGDGWDDDGISLSTAHAVLPCTEDSVQLVGVPDVLLINCRQFTLVTAEDKCVKEYPSTKPQKSGNTLTKHLFQCLSVALWHGNAAMWGTRLPAIPPSVDGCL